ncbi:MAG TPA: PilZ domain-containing protein [Sphingomicrobium sp.]
MPWRRSQNVHKPRELRRRIVLTARLRSGNAWSDACILNISSGGLLIHAGRPVAPGSRVELWRGDQVIHARVVWRDGARAGLQAQDRVPIDEIVSLAQAPAFQLTAGERRRTRTTTHARSRERARAYQFGGTVVIALICAGAAFGMVEQALARPLAMVTAALGG